MDFRPVYIPHFVVPEFYRDGIKILEELGFEQVTLHGGPFRDASFGIPPADLDFCVSSVAVQKEFSAHERKKRDREGLMSQQVLDTEIGPSFDSLPSYQRMITRAVMKNPGTKILGNWQFTHGDMGAYWVLFNLQVEGMPPFHVMATNLPALTSVAALCANADAPLNGIAMGADGKVYAHPLFENHARHAVYAPAPSLSAEKAGERYKHLSAKIPGLKLLPAGTGEIPDAVPETLSRRPKGRAWGRAFGLFHRAASAHPL